MYIYILKKREMGREREKKNWAVREREKKEINSYGKESWKGKREIEKKVVEGRERCIYILKKRRMGREREKKMRS